MIVGSLYVTALAILFGVPFGILCAIYLAYFSAKSKIITPLVELMAGIPSIVYGFFVKGDDIPIAAQVVSLADVYDALVSRRAYKEAYTPERAMEMIREGQCGVFNPLLVQCLTDIQDALRTEVYAGGPAS